MREILAALLLLGLLTGCASTTADDTRASGSIAESQQSNGAVVPGYSVSVPHLGIDKATLVSLGLNHDGSIQVPPLSQPRELGVYANGPMPGQTGPAVILGHINAGGVDGAFAHLASVKVGDEITTTGPEGATRFVVYRAETILKRDWPTKAIYSDTAAPELRLVSCGGALDATGHNYDSNIIVWARKA